jgi:hypothetical protein
MADVKRIAGAMDITEADFNALPQAVKDGALKLYGDNEVLTKAVSGGNFTLHVGEKGGLVIRGFGNFPHTFFIDQWDRFEGWLKGGGFDMIAKFKAVNTDKLTTKATAVVNKAAATK